MKSIALQLITVKLEDGQHGIFVGTPLLPNPAATEDNQISEVWFSDVRDLPEDMSLDQLIDLVKAQLCRCKESLH